MIKAIIFDLDNTIVDFIARKEGAINAAISALLDAGLQTTFEKAKNEIYKIYSGYNMEDPLIFQKFLKKYGKEDDVKLLAKALYAYRKANFSVNYVFPQAKKTLLELSKLGIKIGILTDAPKQKAWNRLVENGLEDFFSFVITIDDTKATKLTDVPFNFAKQHLGLKPEEVLLIGDSPERDIKQGKKAGFKTCFAAYGYYQSMLPPKPPKRVIHGITKLCKPDFTAYEFADILKITNKMQGD